MQKVAIAALCAGLMLNACTHTGSGNKDAPKKNAVTDTRTYAGKCLFLDGEFQTEKDTGEDRSLLATIGGLLLTQLIERGFSLVGSALSDAATPKDSIRMATTNIDTQADVKCIQVVRGRFAANAELAKQNDTKQDAAKDAKEAKTPSPLDGKYDKLAERRIYLADDPDFFLEAAFRTRKAGFSAPVPTFVYYGTPIESRTLRPSGTRHITVGFALSGPGDTVPTEKATEIVLGEMEPNTVVDYKVKANKDTKGAFPGEGRWLVWLTKDNKPVEPLSITAIIIEHQSKSEFYGMLSRAFEAKKQDLESEAKQRVLRSERDKADAAQRKGEVDAKRAFEVALGSALDALEACQQSGSRADALKAREAITSLASLGYDLKGVSRGSVRITGTADEIKASCKSAAETLSGIG